MFRSFAFALLLLVPLALAGTQDTPEIADPAGDATCNGPLGNEYADIVASWIDGETESSFMVHIALQKFTQEALATATGYTVQFSHQGVQYGAIAAYIPPPFGDGWEYDNGYINTETGELGDFQDAEGSFTPGSPAIISISFAKSMFPHGDATDNKLVGFTGGSADFKNWVPFFFAPMDPPVPFQTCDSISSDAQYEFQVGGHSAHAAPANTEEASAPTDAAQPAATEAPAAQPQAPGSSDTPFAPVALALMVVAGAALVARRR